MKTGTAFFPNYCVMLFELRHLKPLETSKHITKKVIFMDTHVANCAIKTATHTNPIYGVKQRSKYAAGKIIKCAILLRSALSNLFILMTN